jgi:uncharacterized protein (DUF983 family)
MQQIRRGHPVPDIAPVVWKPAIALPDSARPGVGDALKRGVFGHCPACGRSPLFRGFLRPVEACANCAAPLGKVRADDLPPYVVILIVGHIVVPLMLWLERAEAPPLWVHTAIFVPLTLGLTMALLRPVKGAVVGLMVHLGMPGPEEDA